MTRRKELLLLYSALLLATLAAYQPAWHGGILWDDAAHLTAPALASTSGLWRIWFDVGATQQYYPVAHSAFWLMNRIWGGATIGYHLVNIALHATSALLVWLILRRLRIPGAVLAAVIFALHPVHVESVAWMTELKNTLSGVCCLAAALAYLHYADTRRRAWYAAALALFVLALLSKTVTAVLPATLLVVFWWQRGELRWRRDVRPLLIFSVLALAGGLTTAWFERTVNGARGAEFHLGLADRVLVAGRAVWFYLGTLVWPAHLVFIYPRWRIDRTDVAQYAYPLAVLALLGGLWALRRRSRAPLAAMLLFCGILFPALGFVDVYPFRYTFVADHFEYLASIPIIALASAGLVTYAAIPFREAVLVALLGVPLAVLTWIQAHDYQDAGTLYRATLARNPECWLCHNNLATPKLAGSESDLDEAAAHLAEALRLNPGYAEAHNNMGGVLQRRGRFEAAIAEHEQAFRLNPDLVEARYNVGVCDQALGRMEDARRQYAEAIRLQPDYPAPHYNLATVFAATGRYDEAAAEYRETIRLTPDAAAAHDGLGDVLLQTGRVQEAVAEIAAAARLQPASAPAHYKLGVMLAELGRDGEAAAEFATALDYDPGAAEIHNDLGAALVKLGRVADAIVHFREALRLRPGYSEAQVNLDRALRGG